MHHNRLPGILKTADQHGKETRESHEIDFPDLWDRKWPACMLDDDDDDDDDDNDVDVDDDVGGYGL